MNMNALFLQGNRASAKWFNYCEVSPEEKATVRRPMISGVLAMRKTDVRGVRW
jgi:hypothetical protein